jgi:hypothetical protein
MGKYGKIWENHYFCWLISPPLLKITPRWLVRLCAADALRAVRGRNGQQSTWGHHQGEMTGGGRKCWLLVSSWLVAMVIKPKNGKWW